MERFSPPKQTELPGNEQALLAKIQEIQTHNAQWIAGRFEMLRRTPGNWNLDTALIRAKDGRFVGAAWSSFDFYASDQGKLKMEGLPPIDLNLESLAVISEGLGELVVPIVDPKDTRVLWHASQTNTVLPALQQINKDALPVEPYPAFLDPNRMGQLVADIRFRRFMFPGAIQITRMDSGKAGIGELAKRGVMLGRLGFWQSDHYGGYFPRVYIEPSAINPRHLVISPFDINRVIESGAIPMAENHQNIDTLRAPESKLFAQDYYFAVFDQVLSNRQTPFALRYITVKPWIEAPKHP